MINKYEERLGTERMLPLVFKMALPAVAAQFVNLLYSIVDRIYIGHIPGIGTDALAGVGVTISLVVLISSFSAMVGGGGAPLAAISPAGGVLPRKQGAMHLAVHPVRQVRATGMAAGAFGFSGHSAPHKTRNPR